MNYYEVEPQNNSFSNIVIDLTHQCNMECANCYIPNRDIPDLDKNKLFDFLGKLPNRTYIRLIGAEPTMRPDIFEIIETTKKLGHRPSLTTNGLKLADKNYVTKLKDAGLRLFLLSMNGADDDEVYKVLDGGKWATVKVRALRNVLNEHLPVNTGTIIAKNINEHTLKRQVELFGEIAKECGINLNETPPYNKIKPVLRVKSVGKIGRYINDASYNIEELKQIAVNDLGVNYNDIFKTAAGVVRAGPTSGETQSSWMFEYETVAGSVYVRLIDWEVDDEGVIDHDNTSRGRLTQNWTIAPFFEHVKKNEFGY